MFEDIFRASIGLVKGVSEEVYEYLINNSLDYDERHLIEEVLDAKSELDSWIVAIAKKKLNQFASPKDCEKESVK